MPKKPTEINGLTLKSEFEDKEIYEKIRSLQFLFLHTYALGDALKILEIKLSKGYHYVIKNENLGLIGFVGRGAKNKKITYIVKDFGRLRWAALEGFDLTEEILNKIGVMAKCKDMSDFILFMAGKTGYEFNKYLRG